MCLQIKAGVLNHPHIFEVIPTYKSWKDQLISTIHERYEGQPRSLGGFEAWS